MAGEPLQTPGAGAYAEADDAQDRGEPRDGADPLTPAPVRPHPARRPLRRRPLVVLAAVLAGVLVLSGAADVLLARTARQRIERAAMCKLRPAGRVTADLSGRLAGLRLLTGSVGTVRVRAGDVRRGGLRMSVVADLRDVTTKGHTAGGTATATVAYEDLRAKLGNAAAGLRPGGDGHGGLVLTGTLAGVPLPVTVHTRIAVAADRITVTPTSVSVLGEDFPVDRLAARPDGAGLARKLRPRTVRVPQLPTGVRLERVTATDDGLVMALSLPGSIASSAGKGCTS